MRIAFDLDNTLIRCGYDFPLEQPRHRVWAKLLGGQSLREGIVDQLRAAASADGKYGCIPLRTGAPSTFESCFGYTASILMGL